MNKYICKIIQKIAFSRLQLYKYLPDALFLKVVYQSKQGVSLNLKNPKTFTEKIQWLKLHDRKPEYSLYVDKYEVKKYVASIIGEEYIIPNLGVWDSFDEIDFDKFPKQFVLKCTHDSGGLVICKDKTKLNISKARTKIEFCLKQDFYKTGREWPYKNVPHRIIAEQYLEDNTNHSPDLIDYKFYCFGGIPMYCQMIQNRSQKETIDFFDMEWNPMPFTGLNIKVKKSEVPPKKPLQYNLMISLAKKLSKDMIFSRIDLYDINSRIYFGEITLYPGSGFGTFKPSEWNFKLGELIKI